MTPNLFIKIFRALLDLPKSLRLMPEPRLVMTLLVRNEQDMLEQNLQFHRAMGVDAFIVTDNNSTDNTPDIIRKYAEKGWIVESIVEKATDYAQKHWVDRMVWAAKVRHGATWVINADADEFWYSPTGNLKNVLSQTRANVLRCKVVNMYPEENVPWTRWSRTASHVPDAEERGRRQFIEKMVNGGKQFENHKSKHGGRHWRYFYALYKEGKLEAEYDRVVGLNIQDTLVREGYISPDDHLSKKFEQFGISS